MAGFADLRCPPANSARPSSLCPRLSFKSLNPPNAPRAVGRNFSYLPPALPRANSYFSICAVETSQSLRRLGYRMYLQLLDQSSALRRREVLQPLAVSSFLPYRFIWSRILVSFPPVSQFHKVA